MGLLSGLLLLLGATAVSSISTNSKQDKMLRKYNEDHAGQNVSSADEDANFLRDKVTSEVFNDWFKGEKKMYPKEYIPYFELNSKARFGYQRYLIYKKQWELGVCQLPKQFFENNEFTNPNSAIMQKIKHFNETGEMIW